MQHDHQRDKPSVVLEVAQIAPERVGVRQRRRHALTGKQEARRRVNHIVTMDPKLRRLLDRPAQPHAVGPLERAIFDCGLQHLSLRRIARQRGPKGLPQQRILRGHDTAEDVAEDRVKVVPGPRDLTDQSRMSFDRQPIHFLDCQAW